MPKAVRQLGHKAEKTSLVQSNIAKMGLSMLDILRTVS